MFRNAACCHCLSLSGLIHRVHPRLYRQDRGDWPISRDINCQIVIYFGNLSIQIVICRRTQTNSWNPCWPSSVVSFLGGGRDLLLMNDGSVHRLVSWWIIPIYSSSPLWKDVHKLCLTLAILELLSSYPHYILWRGRQNHRCLIGIIDCSVKTRVFILMLWSLEWLFECSSDSVETETDSRLVARGRAAWLLRVH